MGQPGQTVKVDFAGGHDASPARKSSPGLRLAGSVRVGDSRLAIGRNNRRHTGPRTMVTGRPGAAERRGTRRPGQRFVPVNYPCPRLKQQSIELLPFREINPQERPKRVALAKAIASSKVS